MDSGPKGVTSERSEFRKADSSSEPSLLFYGTFGRKRKACPAWKREKRCTPTIENEAETSA